MRPIVTCGVSLLIGLGAAAPALGQSAQFAPEPISSFEARVFQQAAQSGALMRDLFKARADGNARGIALRETDAAIVDLTVEGRKYGISLDGTGEVLIKNFQFSGRRSGDIFGAGVILGQSAPTRAETWLSNAWIDLKGRGPIPDYKLANNEAVSVELDNAPLNIRSAVLIGGEESGLDNKSNVRMDATFVASGHRSIRVWSGARLVMANSIVLLAPVAAIQTILVPANALLLATANTSVRLRQTFELALAWVVLLPLSAPFGPLAIAAVFSAVNISYLPRFLQLTLPVIQLRTSDFLLAIGPAVLATAALTTVHLLARASFYMTDLQEIMLSMIELAVTYGLLLLACRVRLKTQVNVLRILMVRSAVSGHA